MYNLSQDYENLFELVSKGEEPEMFIEARFVDDHKDCLKRIRDRSEFIEYCNLLNLRWIDPQPVAERFFFIDEIRDQVNQLQAEEITIGKFIELLNEKATGLNKEANDALRSCYSIVQRKGENTNWEAIEKVLKSILDEQHKAISDPQPVAQTKIEQSIKLSEAYESGQQSIIEKLKALQYYELCTNQEYVSKEDIETIINQSK